MLIRIRVGWNAALTYLPSLLTDNIRYTERLSTAITIRKALLTHPAFASALPSPANWRAATRHGIGAV